MHTPDYNFIPWLRVITREEPEEELSFLVLVVCDGKKASVAFANVPRGVWKSTTIDSKRWILSERCSEAIVERRSRVVAWLRNLDERCCNSGSMNCADGVTFSTTRPGLPARKAGGIACAARHPSKANVTVGSSRILKAKRIVVSQVVQQSRDESKRDPQDLDIMYAADVLCIEVASRDGEDVW